MRSALGMPVAQIQRYAQLAQQGDTTVAERLELREAHAAAVTQKLADIAEYLARIRGKIAHYRESEHIV